jgi:hypothetical protein
MVSIAMKWNGGFDPNAMWGPPGDPARARNDPTINVSSLVANNTRVWVYCGNGTAVDPALASPKRSHRRTGIPGGVDTGWPDSERKRLLLRGNECAVGVDVGGGCQYGGMAGKGSLRRIGDPLVAAAPMGVRIRTRIHPTVEEAQALTAIGAFLGSVYRGELAERNRRGVLDREGRAVLRAERKRALTAVASSLNLTGSAD